MTRRITSLALALALTLTLATSAFAGTSTTVQTVSATINGTISMTGVPSTLALSGTANSMLAAPAFTITVTSSDAFQVRLTATELTGPGTPIAADRFMVGTNGGAFIRITAADQLIGSTTPLVEIVHLDVQSGQAAGVYNGTLTWTASN